MKLGVISWRGSGVCKVCGRAFSSGPHVECSDEKKRLAAGKKVAKRYAKGRALPFISGAK